MLQELRDKSTGIVAKIIMGFLAVIFALWGTDALFENSKFSIVMAIQFLQTF
jgi:peptidyl-prolyl cis-trans isomerase D